MKYSFVTLASTAFCVQALPSARRQYQVIDDTTVLNFALTLEHLENAFYQGALAQFDEQAFIDAGLPAFARERFVQVAEHEKTHVQFLTSALGDKATKPCKYSFPYTDPKSFAALSQALEGVGVSAYTGAAQLITNKDYLTAAASVLATEARHASWVASAVNKFAGWSGSFDVPLGLHEVFSLAASFITSCPSSNPQLPVKAFPSLTVASGDVTPGSQISLNYKADQLSADTPLFVAFFTGLTKEFAPLKNNEVTIPNDLVGTVYAVISTSGKEANDDVIVAGPLILNFEFDSNGKIIS